ncbi:hypothetical protein ACQQ7I_06655 [Corynebacterium diphtheriae]
MKISIYSCNEKMAAFMRGEMVCLDVRGLPDPSPTCQDLFGTDPRVWDAIVAEDSQLVTGRAITAVSWALAYKTLCVFCEGGWQRSVAIAEAVAWGLKAFNENPGAKIITTHLGAKNENC